MSDHKPILVTGGTGLLGSYLLRYLVGKGAGPIRALRRKDSPMDLVASVKDRVEWVEGDVLDLFALESAMKGVGGVYHCAAVVTSDPRRHSEMMEVNKEGTANVVNLALEEGIDKLVHVSSIAALGRRKNLTTIDENTKWERSSWNSRYAISKYQSEMEVWRGCAEGLKVAIVNPSVILGGGYWDRGVAAVFKKIWEGYRFYPLGTTGYVDARDVARFMVQLMESEVENERFVLNAANLSYRDFFAQIAQNLHKKAPDVPVGPFLKELFWRADWLRGLFTGERLITKERAEYTSRTFLYDATKSEKVFNFQYTPIAQTIAEMSTLLRESAARQWQPACLPLI